MNAIPPHDLLVRLYDLPAPPACNTAAVRRAFAAEQELICSWVRDRFGSGWASECRVAFARLPIACFVAVKGATLAAFACYDATARGFFGPVGVDENARRLGIGGALLLHVLHDMAAQGYGYAVIGGANETRFYRRYCDATDIPNSAPGFYRALLRQRTNTA
jgi:ribosomal protein S18 acetylase RimI-like enzyme